MTVLTNKRAIANGLFLFALLALPACTGAPWESSFWTPPAAHGVPPIADGSSYPIKRIGSEENADKWPNLGDVPERPAPPQTDAAYAEQLRLLQAQRDAATAAAAQQQSKKGNTPDIPAQPPAIPPELESTDGK